MTSTAPSLAAGLIPARAAALFRSMNSFRRFLSLVFLLFSVITMAPEDPIKYYVIPLLVVLTYLEAINLLFEALNHIKYTLMTLFGRQVK